MPPGRSRRAISLGTGASPMEISASLFDLEEAVSVADEKVERLTDEIVRMYQAQVEAQERERGTQEEGNRDKSTTI
jgi:hypothetical protein